MKGYFYPYLTGIFYPFFFGMRVNQLKIIGMDVA